MGNTASLSAKSFLDANPDYAEYIQASWRSQRAAELDALGGLGRPPLLLGQSFDAKMMFLGNQLQQQGQKMQDIILPYKPSSARGTPGSANTKAKKVYSTFFLNTDRRLAYRRGELVPTESNPKALEALEALGTRDGKGPQAQQLELRKLKEQRQNGKEVPAEWRKRVHQARRNAFLIVLTMNRLKRGHSHPKRLAYFEDLMFTIPQALGEDCPRFIQEQQRYAALRQSITAARTELDELLRSSAVEITAALPGLPAASSSVGTGKGVAAPTSSGVNAATNAVLAGAMPPALVPAPAPTASEGIASPPAAKATASNAASPAPLARGVLLPPAAQPTNAPGTVILPTAAEAAAATKAGCTARSQTPTKSGPEAAAGSAASGSSTLMSGLAAFNASPGKWGGPNSPGLRRRQPLPTVLEGQQGSGNPNPFRKTCTASARYASPSRRPWGVNPGAQLSSASANSRGRRAGSGQDEQGGDLSSNLGGVSRNGRLRQGSGEEREHAITMLDDTEGVTQVYAKPWKVVGREGSKEEGGQVTVGCSNRPTLLAPPRPPLSKRLPQGSDGGPPLLRQCSLPPLRENSNSSEGSGDDGVRSTTPPEPLSAARGPARNAQQASPTQSPTCPRQTGLDKPLRVPAEAAQGGVVSPQGKLSPLQRTQQPGVQGEGAPLQPQSAKPVDRLTRMHELRGLLEQHYEQLKKSGKMMGMYVNRVNGGWAEARKWGPPGVASCSDVLLWAKGDQFAIYKADIIRQLRLGQIAVQLLVGEDFIAVPRSPAPGLQIPQGNKRVPVPSSQLQQVVQDLWTSDLWEVIDHCRPNLRSAIHRLEGLSLGGRAMAQMVLSLQGLAGDEAVKRLHVLLHVNVDQEEEVVAELHQHKWFGLSPENVFILMNQRQPAGMRFNAEDLAFQPDLQVGSTTAWAADSVGGSVARDASQQVPRNMGTGHAMVQLGWSGHAYTIGPEGLHQPVQLPVLELLHTRKLQWMLSRRARDLGLLTKEGVLDLSQLAYAMHLRDQARATAIMEVCFSSSAPEARQHDSVIMQQKSTTDGTTDVASISDLRQSELVTPSVIASVEAQRTALGGRGLALGLGRCLYHLPTLKGAMTSLSVFRPRLHLSKDSINVSLDAADLATGHEKARAKAVEARVNPGLLTSPASLETLMPLLQAQDHDAAFHDLIMDMVDDPEQEAPLQARMVTRQDEGQALPGTPIIVFVARNGVTGAAVNVAANLARGGKDKLILATFVPTSMQQAEGEELLAVHRRTAFRSMAQVETVCVVRGPTGLLDNMERFVEQQAMAHDGHQPLVVMGSVQLTSALFSYVAGSVTLSFIRRSGGIPVIVITANSKQVPERAGMRCLALVEGHSRAMMNNLCKNIIQDSRGDRLLLTQVLATTNLTRQQQANYRHLLDSFYQIAHSNQLPVQKAIVGDGPLDKVLCGVVEDHGVGLLALQLLPGTKAMPQHMLSLLRSCRCATLIYTDPAPVRTSMMRKSGVLRTSMRLLASELAKARETIAAERGAKR